VPERRFPRGFVWGAATSAYQIEGGVDLDDRGPSIWDTFCATPGNVRGGDDGTVACDHRTRMRSDVALMADLGLSAYRFSVGWPRVQPQGSGPVSESGLDFYRRLVDELLGRGIEPFLTLYHWDLPQPLQDAGGWPARDTASRFADYAAVVGAALGDRVRHWSTVNEPWCAAMLGYAAGVHAPGVVDSAAAVAAAHHLLLGHGLAVDALRHVVAADAAIGITLNPCPVVAAGDRDVDVDAARRVDGVANRLWYDALLRGTYPADVLADFATVSDLAHIRTGDLEQIARPLDEIGVNYYRRHHVRHLPGESSAPPWCTWPGSPDVELVQPDAAATAMGWAIEPDGLVETLLRLRDDYRAPPVYVHENGAAFDDAVGSDGVVCDDDRIAFLGAHLRACHRAIEAGVDLRGYFVWTLLDNFEWAHGYRYRFGLVRVSPGALDRVPKASARWYGDVARAGGLAEL
jgi:beta-glucosidase